VQNQARQKTGRARELRREGTDAERMLWKHLRNRQLNGLKFRRQVPLLGFYADFFCESWNNDVMANIEGVLVEIATIAKGATPHPVPLSVGEGTVLLPERH
jgi:very-short-patch-repair endonuclease